MKKHNSRDFAIIHRMNGHYSDLQEDLRSVKSFDEFKNGEGKRRAILFDFLQIGELANQLSKEFKEEFNNKNSYALISIRNRVVHGYGTVRDDIVYKTILEELPELMSQYNDFARMRYSRMVKDLLGKKIKVIVDRPIGYNHNGLIYPINYGYTEKLTALDGEFQDAYIIDVKDSVSEFQGTVIAIIHRDDDVEDKLVVAKSYISLSDEEIEKIVLFQEQFFKHHIER